MAGAAGGSDRRRLYTDAVEQDIAAGARTARLDELILELRVLRASADMSYRQLAARIALQREAAGVSPAAARIATSTVSDMFRLGRARINANLFGEVASALEGDLESAARWRQRAVEALSGGDVSTVSAPGAPVPALAPLPDVATPSFTLTASTVPAHPRLALVVFGGLLLNSTGKFFNPLLGDVLFLDMVGTALVALLAGPWASVLVGALFVVVELCKGDIGDALFAVTMLPAALIWGAGVRRGAARSLWRFLALSAVVAVATSVLAVPITMLYFGGAVDRGLEGVYSAVAEGQNIDMWAAVFGVNVGFSLLDKVLTGAIAYAAWRALRARGSGGYASVVPGADLRPGDRFCRS